MNSKNDGNWIGVGTAIGVAGFAISAALTWKIPKGQKDSE